MAEKRWVAHDGDSLYTDDGGTSRLLGLDAPEVRGRTGPDMPGATQARDALQDALDRGAKVRDTGAKGFYGRPLQRVQDDQGDVASDMVARGLADPDRTTVNALDRHWLNDINGEGPIRPEWDRFAREASDAQLDFIDRRFSDLMATAEQVKVRGYHVNPRTDTVGKAAKGAIGRGVDQFQGSLYGFSEVIGGAIGADAMEKWGRDGMLRNLTEAAMNPARVETWEDIDGIATFGMYVLETLMEESPAFATDIAVGLATGGSVPVLAGIGKSALRRFGAAGSVGKAGSLAGAAYSSKFSRAGMNLGLTGSIYPQMIGDTRQSQFSEGLANEEDANSYALGIGTAKAVTEFVAVRKILNNVLRGASPDDGRTILGLAREAKDVRSFTHALGRGLELGADSGFAQGTAELMQELLDQFGNMSLDPDREMAIADLDVSQLIEGALRGSIFGTTVGTVGATGAGVIGAAQNRDRMDNEQQRREHGDTIPSDADTTPEPLSGLVTQLRETGKVWMSRTQTPQEAQEVVASLQAQGIEAYARTSADGDVYVTTEANDPLLTKEGDITGSDYARSRGYTPKEELNPNEPLKVVQAINEQGEVVQEAGTDETHLVQTTEAVRRNAPNTTLRVLTPEDALAERESRRSPADDLSGLEADPIQFQHKVTEPVVGKQLGQFDSQEAAQLAERQAERSVVQVDEQAGKTSLFKDGKLRSVSDLIADFRAKRLDRAELQRILQRYGIDPGRFAKRQTTLDPDRTRDAIRHKLLADRKLAAQFAGTTFGENYHLADIAMNSLNEAGDRELRRAAEQVGVEPRATAVPKDAQATRVVRGRVLSAVGKKKFPRALKQSLAERFLGDPNQYDALVDYARSLEGQDLVRFADAVNVDTRNLLEDTAPTEADALAMFRELDERIGKQRGPQPQPPRSPNVESRQERRGQPSGYQQIRESFDWLFAGDGQALAAPVVIEQQGGVPKTEQQMEQLLTQAMEQMPELGDEITRHLDRKKSQSRTQRLPAIIEATQKALSDIDADAAVAEAETQADTAAEHRLLMQEAVQDLGFLRHLDGLGIPLDIEKATDMYWRFTWPVSGEAPVARLKAELEDVESRAEQGDITQSFQILTQHWERENGLEAGAFDAEIAAVAASNPTDTEGAVLEALFVQGMIGRGASLRRRDPFVSSSGAPTANIPSRAREPNRDDTSFEQALTPTEMSDRLFYVVLNRASLKLPRFFDINNAKLPKKQWSEGENSFQEARHNAMLQPGEMYQSRNDPNGPLYKLGMFFSSAIFHQGLNDRNATDVSNAASHTKLAKGQNLLLLETDGLAGAKPRFVDAITLANYRKDGAPSTLADAFENLEDNLARLADGLYVLNDSAEEGQDSRPPLLKINESPVIPDDLVIWQDHNGVQYTAAQAREQRNTQRTTRNKVADAGRRRDELAQELEQVNGFVDAALDQIADVAETDGDTATLDLLQQLSDAEADNLRRIEAGQQPEYSRTTQLLSQLGQMTEVNLGDGVIGTLRNVLTKRYDIFRDKRALNEFITHNADQMQTSLQGDKALDDWLERDSQPEIDAEGFDQRTGRAGATDERFTHRPGSPRWDVPHDNPGKRAAERGRVFLEDSPSARRIRDVRSALGGFGTEIYTRRTPEGGLFLTTNPNDPALDESTPLTAAVVEETEQDFVRYQALGTVSLGNAEREADSAAIYEESRDDRESMEGYQDMMGRPDPVEQDSPDNPELDQVVPQDQLTDPEARVEYAKYGQALFNKLPPEFRGIQIDAVPKPKKAESAPQVSKATPRKLGVSRVGKAANRRDFQGLESFTRRMMALVSRGQGRDGQRFSQTPVTIVETGDQAALEQLSREAGHTSPPSALRALFHAPGYLNLHGRVVIAMDRKPPRGSRAEWLMTFGHELGHMFYDQSWHVLPQRDRGAIQQEFTRLHGGEYNGKTGLLGFKEWYADQMASAIADDVTRERRGQYLDGNGPLQRALRAVIDRLQKLWSAIQQDKSVRRLARFKQNDTFAKYAKRVLRGEVPLSHRYETDTLETLHFTPDQESANPTTMQKVAQRAAANPIKYSFSGLVRSAIGRIRSYNQELGDSLFQASNRNRVRDGSYEQKRYALNTRYSAWFQQSFDEIKKGSKKQQVEAVNQAYVELRDGKDTRGAQVLRRMIDSVIRDARKEGWQTTPEFSEGSMIRAYDHKAIETRRGDFFALAQEALPKVSAADLNERIDRIVHGFGIEELSHEPMGPGKAVGTHAEAQLLMDAIGTERLAEEGFLQDKGTGVLQHFAAGIAKRVGWESTMGGWTSQDGSYSPQRSERIRRAAERTGQRALFDPNAHYKHLLNRIKEEHGEVAEREVRDLVSGALGHNNLGANQKARVAQEWVVGVSNMMILGFSGVMSVPEAAIAPVRAGFNFKEIADSLGNLKEAREFARAIGVVMTTGAEQIARESIGEGYQSNLLSKASNAFFTVNGQQFVTRASRTFATAIGMQFVSKAARDGDSRSLEKLGLTPQDVRAWEQAGRPPLSPDMEGPVADVTRKVSAGVAQFVNDGTLNPNKFQATGWGTNPYLKLIWQLKQFFWTMGDTVISATGRRMVEQYHKGRDQGYTAGMSVAMASLPAQWLMGLSLPLVYLSLSLRAILSGSDREPLETEEGLEKVFELTRRAGFFAQWEMIHGAYRTFQWEEGAVNRGLGLGGVLSPAFGVANDIVEIKDWEFDAQKSAENLKRYVPLASQWKGTWQWFLD